MSQSRYLHSRLPGQISACCSQQPMHVFMSCTAWTRSAAAAAQARAVANRTDACFIRVIGSELVQKYVGEGARMVRELFQMARSKKACLIFFDEVDAIGGARFDDGAGKLLLVRLLGDTPVPSIACQHQRTSAAWLLIYCS